ncbi:hypothetical protein K8942_03380 [Candidatus Peribacteria bacterium]|nr:MAG: hypothetical protein K8942_03380 [Candidatus Peribacteria bacterium]
MSRSLSLLVASAITLSAPMSAFAATAAVEPAADPVTTDELLDVISPAMPAAVDGKGGGYMMDSSIYYPGNPAGVQVSASVTKNLKPDFVAINAYCESGKMASRQAARDMLQQVYTDIKNFVGADGRVRKSGSVSAYPYYDGTGVSTDSFNATLSIFIRITNRSKVEAISDYVEGKGCSVSWDVRLVNTQTHELSILDELATQLNARKAVFEKLLGKRLTTITSANLSTWADGYGTYDPEDDTVDATSTLTVTFDLGGRATLTPSKSNAASRAAARSAK